MKAVPKEYYLSGSQDHLRAFGSIIAWYARHETMMQILVAAFMKAQMAGIFAMTGSTGYQAKRDALLGIMKMLSVPTPIADRTRALVRELDRYSGLRNSIAHHSWTPGERPGSIKPIFVKTRGGNPKTYGIDPTEPDYTAEELATIADDLARLYNDFANAPEIVALLEPMGSPE